MRWVFVEYKAERKWMRLNDCRFHRDLHSLGGKFALLASGTLVRSKTVRASATFSTVRGRFFVEVQLEADTQHGRA